MSIDDYDDRDLGRALGRAVGGVPDLDAAYASFQRRARTARRRRTAVWMGTAGVLALLFVGVAVARPDGDVGTPLSPAADPSSSIEGTVTESSSTATSEPDTSMHPEEVVTGTVDERDGDDDSAVNGTLPASTQARTGSTIHPTVGTTPDGTTNTSTSGSTTPTTPPATNPSSTNPPATPGATRVCSSAGGSMTVRDDGGRLQIVATAPATGFTLHESEAEPDKAVAKFESANAKYEVTARLKGGSITCSVKEDLDS